MTESQMPPCRRMRLRSSSSLSNRSKKSAGPVSSRRGLFRWKVGSGGEPEAGEPGVVEPGVLVGTSVVGMC